MNKTLLIITFLLFSSVCSAHHGTGGQFDQSKSMEITGVVTKIRFVNPHSYVYLDVTNNDGGNEEWRCEMRASTVLKRSGWTEDMFKPGTWIHIVGVPARREPTGCYVNSVEFEGGEVVKRYQQLNEGAKDVPTENRLARLADGHPNISGDWAATQRLPTESEVRARAMGGRPGGGGQAYVQTQAGIDASAGYEREDNPRFRCMATNIIFDWTFDQHINRISQSENIITLAYGFMDIERTVYIGMDKHPVNIDLSTAGHSIGQWEGDTLVIDTIGFTPGYLSTRDGTKHSDQLHIVERFSLDAKEKSLSRSYVGNDPLYLTQEFLGQDKIFLSETAFDPYNCEDLTEEVVEGF